MKRLILSIAMSMVFLVANLASGQDVKKTRDSSNFTRGNSNGPGIIYGKVVSLSDGVMAVGRVVISLPPAVNVLDTSQESIPYSSIREGDYVAVSLLSKTEVLIRKVTRGEAEAHMFQGTR